MDDMRVCAGTRFDMGHSEYLASTAVSKNDWKARSKSTLYPRGYGTLGLPGMMGFLLVVGVCFSE